MTPPDWATKPTLVGDPLTLRPFVPGEVLNEWEPGSRGFALEGRRRQG